MEKIYWKNRKGHREIVGADMVMLEEKYGTPLYILFDDIIWKNV